MIAIKLMTAHEIIKHVAQQVHAKRLSLNLSQRTLAERSGVSYGVIKKFERTGQISLESLAKLALILDSFDEFKNLFKPMQTNNISSIDELFVDKKRKRGRK